MPAQQKKNKILNKGDKTMTLATYLVDINTIQFTQKNDYSEELINELAQLLIKQEGTTKPIIVKSTALATFELIEGEIVLLAAIKAQQIDPSFEMIRAYIEEGEEDFAIESELIAKISATKQEHQLIFEQFTELLDELKVDVSQIETKEPTDWLIVDEEYVAGGDWYSLNQQEIEIRNADPKAKTIVKTMRDEQWLLAKKAEYEAYLADINKELTARDELL